MQRDRKKAKRSILRKNVKREKTARNHVERKKTSQEKTLNEKTLNKKTLNKKTLNEKTASPLETRKMNRTIRIKLVCLFIVVILALVCLGFYVVHITRSQGQEYKQQVLSQSQQRYGSTTIPFKRGDILDCNGTVLATSERVYKIILDCKVVNDKPEYVEPTIKAMVEV